MIKLSKRLAAIANFVPSGASVVDVGTDHGYIPVFLAQRGDVKHIIASDINREPLASAQNSAEHFGVTECIDFRLCNGLYAVKPEEADTVVIAGMGGEMISSILDDAPWTKYGVRLILQPQSKIGELSNWLDNFGYAIEDAQLVKEDGRIYMILVVRGGKNRVPLSCAEIYVDRVLLKKRDPLLPEYLDMLIAKFSRSLEGMKKAKDEVGVDTLFHTQLALEGFKKMKKETEQW